MMAFPRHANWYQTELETCFQFATKTGFITKPLLHELFQVKTKRTLNRMAWALSRCPLLYPCRINNGLMDWRLSRKGKYECARRNLKPSAPPRIASRTHDEIALLIALRLERAGAVSEWLPEAHFIKEPSNRLLVSQDSRGQKYPDIVLTVSGTSPVFRVAVELELTRKSQSRYEKALRGYQAVRGIDALIFAVRSPHIRTSIEKAVRRTRFERERLPIYFVDSVEFQKSPGTANLEGGAWKCELRSLPMQKRTQNAA